MSLLSAAGHFNAAMTKIQPLALVALLVPALSAFGCKSAP